MKRLKSRAHVVWSTANVWRYHIKGLQADKVRFEIVALHALPSQFARALTHPNLDDAEPYVIICVVISTKCIFNFLLFLYFSKSTANLLRIEVTSRCC